jgi:hypothetical protein
VNRSCGDNGGGIKDNAPDTEAAVAVARIMENGVAQTTVELLVCNVLGFDRHEALRPFAITAPSQDRTADKTGEQRNGGGNKPGTARSLHGGNVAFLVAAAQVW